MIGEQEVDIRALCRSQQDTVLGGQLFAHVNENRARGQAHIALNFDAQGACRNIRVLDRGPRICDRLQQTNAVAVKQLIGRPDLDRGLDTVDLALSEGLNVVRVVFIKCERLNRAHIRRGRTWIIGPIDPKQLVLGKGGGPGTVCRCCDLTIGPGPGDGDDLPCGGRPRNRPIGRLKVTCIKCAELFGTGGPQHLDLCSGIPCGIT